MFKKVPAILLAISFCFTALTACSQGTDETSETSNNLSAVQPSSSQTSHYPLTLSIYDDKGNEMEQTIEKEPERIVVMGQGFVELTLAFGEEEKIVGVAYLDKSGSEYEEEISQLPIITDMWPSKESILELQPDLIISMSAAFQEDRLGDISFWNERGVPVLTGINYTIGRTIDSFFEDITNLGIALDIEDKTDAFVEGQKAQIGEIQKKVAQATDKPRVLLLGISGDTTYYYGPSLCLIDEMIEGVGAEYIKVTDDTYVEMSDESILSVNPDKIIITGYQESDSESLKNKYLLNPNLQNATAIKTGNVMVVEYTNAVRGSFGLADMYEDVAKFIYPELFEEE